MSLDATFVPNELQASAIFLKGRYQNARGGSFGFHHIQITAAGLDRPTADTEPELFKKVPSLDYFTPFLTANDDQVVITLRSIGEMDSQNPNSGIRLADPDEYSIPRAFVSINPSAKDMALWDAMDKMADDTALVFANGLSYEVMVDGAYQRVAANQPPSSVAPFGKRSDKLGTTHHEAGTLAMRWDETGNSGVFVRFPNPNTKSYNNTLYVAVDFGFEVQIDELGTPDGADKHLTGAIYNEDNQNFTRQQAKSACQWNDFEILVEGQTYTVFLNGQQTTRFTNSNPERGLPGTPDNPSYIGFQGYLGSRVAFRNIRFKPLP